MVVVSILLLLFNITIVQFQKKEDEPVKTEDYSFEIDSVFNSVLNEYGIEKVWREKTFIKNRNYDSLKYVYKISLPRDLIVSQIVKSANYAFVNSHSIFKSEELKNYGKTKIKILSGKQLKFEAYLSVDANLYRSKTKLEIFVNINDLSDKTIVEKVLNSPFPLCITAIPSIRLKSLLPAIKNRNKDFAIVISDNIEDKKYLLDVDFDKTKLSRNIKTISRDFSDAQAFIIDNHAEITNSMLYNYIVSQFSKYNKKIVPLSRFILLTSENKVDVNSKFNFYTAGTDTSKVNKVFLSFSNYEMLIPKLKSALRMGTKLVIERK